MTLYPHMYQTCVTTCFRKNFSILERPLYKGLYLEKNIDRLFMFGAILKTTNSSFQKGMTFCRSIYVMKAMKLLAFIFEQPSYKKCPVCCGKVHYSQTFKSDLFFT